MRLQAQQISAMVNAGRDSTVEGFHDLGLVRVLTDLLPPTRNVLDSLDQIVVASDRLLQDSSASEAIGAWVRAGGRLWVMLDRVDPVVVRRLVDDAADYVVVDRVEMNEFKFIKRADPFAVLPPESESWASDQPAEMVRVATGIDDIAYRIDGWPAVFEKPFGNGSVLFTTVSASGWMQGGGFKPTKTLVDVSRDFFVPRIKPPQSIEAAVEFLGQEIGYEIPGRSLVACLLGVHVVILLGAGGMVAANT